jgi:ArsR family transcriptional regulator
MGKFQSESKVFRALAHPVRLQILEALARGPACVYELVTMTGRRQANISQHLALLREARLVHYERAGLNVFYRVNAARLAEVMQIVRPFLQPVNNHRVTLKQIGDDKVSENKNNNSPRQHEKAR